MRNGILTLTALAGTLLLQSGSSAEALSLNPVTAPDADRVAMDHAGAEQDARQEDQDGKRSKKARHDEGEESRHDGWTHDKDRDNDKRDRDKHDQDKNDSDKHDNDRHDRDDDHDKDHAVPVLRGQVRGGVRPVAGAHVYLLAAGSGGYGTSSRSLLTAQQTRHADAAGAFVLTNRRGRFSIPAGFPCAAGDELYVLAQGGHVGGERSNASSLLAVVGGCSTLSGTGAPRFLSINEVTTVATAYGLSAYAADATHIASSGTPLAQIGLANAFSTASSLVDGVTGAALANTVAGNGIVPQAEINTLANLLSGCVNPGDDVRPSCSTLFSYATARDTVPNDTASAAINIAHAPNANVLALFQLAAGQPFAPALTTAPSSWVLPVTYSGGGIDTPRAVAIDGEGNVWIANSNAAVLSKFNTVGVPATPGGFGGGGLAQPLSLAIDSQGDVWAANTYSSTLSKLTNLGQPSSPAGGFSGGGLNGPIGLALDHMGLLWVGDNNAPTLSRFNTNGTAVVEAGYTGGGLGYSNDVEIDGLGNVWISSDGNVLSKFSSTGTPLSMMGFTGGGMNEPQGIAFDASNHVWLANATGASISEFDNNGNPMSSAGFSGGGLSVNRLLAIDGAGNVWSGSGNTGVISELSPEGVPANSTGYVVGQGVTDFWGIAVDGSGNVWAAGVTSNTLTKLVGAAAPVITPLVTAGSMNRFATRP